MNRSDNQFDTSLHLFIGHTLINCSYLCSVRIIALDALGISFCDGFHESSVCYGINDFFSNVDELMKTRRNTYLLVTKIYSRIQFFRITQLKNCTQTPLFNYLIERKKFFS